MEEVMSELVIAHNLNAEKLKTISLMGGFACPSLAIIDNQLPYGDFGDVTLLMGANKISPDKDPIFHSDVYSPRTPIPKYNVDRLGLIEFSDELKSVMAEMGLSDLPLPGDISGSESLTKGLKYALDGLVGDELILAAYAHSKGVFFDVPHEKESSPVAFLNNDDPVFEAISKLNDDALEQGTAGFDFLNKAAIKLVENYAESSPGNTKNAKERMLSQWFNKVGDNYIINGIVAYMMVEKSKSVGVAQSIDTYALKDMLVDMFPVEDVYNWLENRLTPIVRDPYFSTYDSHGEETRLPYTLDNLTEHLKGSIRGEENFFYGAGTIRSLISGQFENWDDVVVEKGRLMRPDEFKPLGDALNDKLGKFAFFMKDYMPKSVDSALSDSAAYSHIANYAKSQDKSVLKPYVKVEDMPSEYFEQLDKFLVELQNSPTAYFEVKMQRSVPLSDFDYAVVPDNISEEAKLMLSQAGVNVSEYKAGDEENRVEVIQSQPVLSIEQVANKPVLDIKVKRDEANYSPGFGYR